MSTTDYYYLHTNGLLIHKNPSVLDADPDYFDSPFVKRLWAIDTDDRMTAWRLVVESLASGAVPDRVLELAEAWSMDADDLARYMIVESAICESAGLESVSDERQAGLALLIRIWGLEFERDIEPRLLAYCNETLAEMCEDDDPPEEPEPAA